MSGTTTKKQDEYAYFYDESIDDPNHDEDGSSDVDADPSIYTHVVTQNNERRKIPYVFMCGKRWQPVHEYYQRKDYEATLFWWTYRYNFFEIRPYGITSDAGWGCMLRSAQMLLTHALRVHFKSNEWRPPDIIDASWSTVRKDALVRSIMTWFADFPSRRQSVYSVHNMCAAGMNKYEVLPGEWYGPGTACYILRDLVALHQQQQPPATIQLFRVHVSSEGTLYKDTIYELMTRDTGTLRRKQKEMLEKEQQKQTQHQQKQKRDNMHPLDPDVILRDVNKLVDVEHLEWDTSLLLLIPLRLGLDELNEEYTRGIAEIFGLPQSVGILGGRPRGARWFYGAYADGSKILGLDPHTVQPAPKIKKAGTNRGENEREWSVDLTDEYLASVHTSSPEVLDINQMDPSIALGFYCRNKQDFHDLERALTKTDSKSSASPQLVSFVDKLPGYMAAATENETGIHDLDDDDAFFDDPKDTISDEDDYVLL